MGQLVKLVNWTKLLISNTGLSASFKDINGTSRSFPNPISGRGDTIAAPFFVYNTGTSSSASDSRVFPYASSDATIPPSQTTITNQIGSCTIGFTRTEAGWAANITITGSGLQDETVNSLLFTQKLYNGSNYYEALLFAYILDSPITLNAGNNYTANLTMSVSFG